MPTNRLSVRCALVAVAVCAPLAIFGGAPSTPAGASPRAALTADGDVSGPASAVQQAIRVAPPTTSAATTTTVPGSTTTLPASTGLVFPMNPEPFCLMLNNFGDARSGSTHEGVDILGYYKWTADQIPNQEVYAVVNGTLGAQKKVGDADAEKSGNSWRLYAAGSQTYYMYAHLSRFADGLTNGSVVKQGQLIGYVGDTGNPGTGNFHLHFEVHPTGAPHVVVNPVPLLKPVTPASCNP